ncbi:phenylacetate--CoA ligase family protein [Geodermatophilus sp. SYSU D00710]
MTDYQELRQRHLAEAAALAPALLARLEEPPDRLAAHRRDALRRLVRVARDLSPWHRKRLAGIDPDEVTEESLRELPVMTKDDLMGSFDEIVTDDRLTLDVVEDHLDRLTSDAYLFDRYHACASGGSSGRRGVFVYDWEGWATVYWSLMRHPLRALRTDPALAGVRPRLAVVAAAAPTHMTSAAPQTFTTPQVELLRFPVTLPTAELVAGLNDARPPLLCGYASALHELAAEARAGRLRIAPAWVIAASEPLLPETRAALTEAFGVPVGNWYGTSEAGGNGSPCRHGTHLADDLMVNELVDEDGRPVPAGVRSDKVFLTNLYNTALPLIRYELTDQLALVEGDCPCGSTHRRIEDPQGRLDDVFAYGGLRVHPHVFRSPLSRRREVVEYQVRQTPRGAEIAVHTTGPLDGDALAAAVAGELARLGVPDPQVRVTAVDRIPRPPSGKLRRFVPLPAA